MKNQACADAFLQCCLKGERLRQKKIQEDAQKGFGRSKIRLSCQHHNTLVHILISI